jgi:hypothetical protein
LSSFDEPQSNRLILSTAGQALSIGAKRDGPKMSVVPLQRLPHGLLLEIPQGNQTSVTP